jgi:FkbM family methyltransferase
VNVGNRSKGAVLRAPLQAGHYRALAGMLRVYPRPLANLRRFLTGAGTYPYEVAVRTPQGTVRPTAWTSHDLSTVNEIFCRRDYRAGDDLRVAVDVGANIGIAALYFLTRNDRSRVYCYEPLPRNVERLRLTLAGLEDRYEVHEVAVGMRDGEATFGVEETGRYGGMRTETVRELSGTIQVRVRDINGVLASVLEREDRIDVLKIDIEGDEEDVVAAIAPHLLERIGVIYYETDAPAPLHAERYEHRYGCQTNRLRLRRSPADHLHRT